MRTAGSAATENQKLPKIQKTVFRKEAKRDGNHGNAIDGIQY